MQIPDNFCGLDEEFSNYENSKIVILPVPYDGTSTWIKGSDKGPRAIIEASKNMEVYDIETDSVVADKGIHTAEELNIDPDPEKTVDLVEKQTTKFLDNNKFVVTIGGEHSITTGAVRAHAKKYKNMSVLQLDAHADLRDSYEGSKYNHACVMSRIKELCPIVQVGIRSMSEEEVIDKDRVIFAKDMHHEWMDKAIDKLSDNVYLTFDLDAFDPAVLPSTGTPEPGGLLWWQAMRFLKKVAEKKNIVGFDVVELCPTENKASDFTPAKLVYKLLSYIFIAK